MRHILTDIKFAVRIFCQAYPPCIPRRVSWTAPLLGVLATGDLRHNFGVAVVIKERWAPASAWTCTAFDFLLVQCSIEPLRYSSCHITSGVAGRHVAVLPSSLALYRRHLPSAMPMRPPCPANTFARGYFQVGPPWAALPPDHLDAPNGLSGQISSITTTGSWRDACRPHDRPCASSWSHSWDSGHRGGKPGFAPSTTILTSCSMPV